ncbi:unnamed protein product [Linum trigynum]|uniref:Uncharacterized protein n=1 Tax=Linum trigynum TaxID=586398 RepID=A0AAV2G5B0_9ROSI
MTSMSSSSSGTLHFSPNIMVFIHTESSFLIFSLLIFLSSRSCFFASDTLLLRFMLIAFVRFFLEMDVVATKLLHEYVALSCFDGGKGNALPWELPSSSKSVGDAADLPAERDGGDDPVKDGAVVADEEDAQLALSGRRRV